MQGVSGHANHTSVTILDLLSKSEDCEAGNMTTRFRDLKGSEYWSLGWPFLAIALIGMAARIGNHLWMQLPPCDGAG